MAGLSGRASCRSGTLIREISAGYGSRLRVDTMDLRIASIALSLGLVLLTRNSADFARVPGLIVEDWTQ
jgi:predicted nucleic acid-binding protein